MIDLLPCEIEDEDTGEIIFIGCMKCGEKILQKKIRGDL